MAEGVLVLAADRRAPLPAHELFPLERVKPFFGLLALEAANRTDRAEPEDLPQDGRILEKLLLAGG